MDKGSYIHLAWQLPQIIVMSAAEIMFSITSLEFAFTQVNFKYIFIQVVPITRICNTFLFYSHFKRLRYT